MHRLGDDEADVMGEAVRQPRAASARRDRHDANVVFTQTSPSRTSTGQVGTSSAHRSKVQPLSRSKRAWCQ